MKSSFSKAAVLAALVLAGVAMQARAVITITTSAGPGEPHFYKPDATTPVADGMTYQIGTFAPGANLALAASDPASLFSSWQPFASGTVNTNPFTLEPGSAGADLDGADSFAGKQIYWWVFQTSDSLAPAPFLANVTADALFTGPAPAWVFPAPGLGVPPVISTGDSLTFQAGSLSGGNVVLVPVPEPGVLCFGASAAVFTLLRRRRLAPTA